MNKVQEQVNSAIEDARRQAKEQKKFFKKYQWHFECINAALAIVEEWIVRVEFDRDRSIDIHIAGDHHVFQGVWAALRKLGYEPDARPKEEKMAAFSTYFRKTDWPMIWLNFSSTKCTRKKIGTKMVEQPVYEVVCE